MFKGIVHYLLGTGWTACGALYDGIESRAAVELRGVTCKKCLAHAREQKANDTREAGTRTKTVTLYTLAPATLDKPGTESMGSYWLYSSEQVPEQALREVVMSEEKYYAQKEAYTRKMPYITFTEVGLAKALKRGEVYRHDNGVSGVAFDPMKAVLAVEKSSNQKEVEAMPRTKIEKLPARTQKVQDIREKEKAPVVPQVPALEGMTPLGLLPDAKIRTLDAILATPIVVKEENKPAQPVVVASAYSLAHDPLYVQLAQLVVGLQNKVESLEHRLLVKFLEAEQGQKAPEPVKDPDIWDILGDGTGAPQPVAVKPKSPLRILTQPAAPKEARAQSGKTDPAIVKAIQTAWKGGKTTQAALAAQYGMTDKRIWAICNRMAQL